MRHHYDDDYDDDDHDHDHDHHIIIMMMISRERIAIPTVGSLSNNQLFQMWPLQATNGFI